VIAVGHDPNRRGEGAGRTGVILLMIPVVCGGFDGNLVYVNDQLKVVLG